MTASAFETPCFFAAAGAEWKDLGLVFTREGPPQHLRAVDHLRPGNPIDPDRVQKLWDKTVARLGLHKITFHGLRHTHSTVGSKVVPQAVMQRRLGNANVAMTANVYTHYVPEYDHKAARDFVEIVKAAASDGEEKAASSGT